MIDYSKDSKGPFTFNSKDDQASKKEGSQSQEDDKKNLDWQQHTPSKNKPAAPDLALGGGKKNISAGKKTPTEELTVILDPEEKPMEWWRKIDSNGPSKDGYSFELTLKNDETKMALDDSDIDHIRLRKDGVKVAEFNNGWEKAPETIQDWDELEKVKKTFTDTDRKFYPIAPDPDKDPDRDR